MKEQTLQERFKQLAGLKPLYEQEDPRRPKDKEFDDAQAMSRLTPDDRDKVGKIQQMIGKEKDKSYDEVYLKNKLVGFKDAYEYDNGKITIYPNLGSVKYKSRSTQEIVFKLEKGDLHFVRAFGLQKSYDELKKVLPELGEMGGSSFSGFMNVGVDDPSISLAKYGISGIEMAHDMIQALNIGREGEAAAQSKHYGAIRTPGTGGTGIEEGNGYDGYFDGYPGNWDSKPDEKYSDKPFPLIGEKQDPYDALTDFKDGLDFSDLKYWMETLEEETTIYVPDLYQSKLGDSTPKTHKIFPKGTSNIGFTLQGWLEEFEEKYPEALFTLNDDKDTLKVVDTREKGVNLKWFKDVKTSKSNRFDNSPKPGSWRKSDNMGNLTDPWS
jgi:hypothetical protein